MYDNITIFIDDAELYITEFTARKVIRLLKKRIANGEKTVQNYAFLADAYVGDRKYKKALKCALKAKKLDRDYYYTNVILIDIYVNFGKFTIAEKYLTELFELAPDDYYRAYSRGMYLYSCIEGKEDFVRKYANNIIDLNKTAPDYLFIRALAHYYLGEFSSALKYFFKAFKTTCKTTGLSGQLMLFFGALVGLLFEKFNFNFYFYSKFINKICYLLGECSRADYYYGNSSNYYDEPKKCLKNINKAIELGDNLLYLIRKAQILIVLGEVEDAIQLYNTVLKKDKSYVECYKYLSYAYVYNGEYKLALESVNLSLLSNPNDEGTLFQKVIILRRLKKYEEALNVLDKIKIINPESQNLYYFYAGVHSEMSDYDKALLNINKQLIKEKDAANYREKLYYLYRLERYEEAIENGKKSLDFEEQGITYYWLTCCYEHLENYEEALNCINNSILYGEYDKWTFWHKSNILGALGREKEAEFAYNKAKELGYSEQDD